MNGDFVDLKRRGREVKHRLELLLRSERVMDYLEEIPVSRKRWCRLIDQVLKFEHRHHSFYSEEEGPSSVFGVRRDDERDNLLNWDKQYDTLRSNISYDLFTNRTQCSSN